MAFYSGNARGRDNAQLAIFMIAIGIVAWIISALIGPIISAAVSRQREYLADASGAEITRFPEGLQGALGKLRDYGRPMRKASSSMAHMYISDPIKPSVAQRLFSTHPPLDKRIERLGTIGGKF
jgi:heat shock protein HtpX